MEFLESLETFAEDLHTFVMCECYGVSRNMPYFRGSPFQGSMRMTVRQLLKVTEVVAVNIFNDLIGRHERLTAIRFRLFTTELVLEVSKRRYDPFEFVLFATLLSKLAVMGLTGRCGDCSSAAITAVVEVGQQFRLKGQFNLPALIRLHKEICVDDVLPRLDFLTL